MASKNGISKSEDGLSVETLAEVFSCFICMGKLKDARICPHCSKLCCYECISHWLNVQNQSQCPYCRAGLRLHEMVKCVWGEEVTQHLDALQGDSSVPARELPVDSEYEICSEHDEKMSLYCGTCRKCLCHQCWDNHNYNHVVKPFHKAFEQHCSQREREVAKLKRQELEVKRLIQKVDNNIESVQVAKDKRLDKIINAVHSILDQLDSELKRKLSTLTERKDLLTAKHLQIEDLLSEIEEVPSGSKLDVINQSRKVCEKVDQISKTLLYPAFAADPVSTDFNSGYKLFDNPTCFPTWPRSSYAFGANAATSSTFAASNGASFGASNGASFGASNGASNAKPTSIFGGTTATPSLAQPTSASGFSFGSNPATQQLQTGSMSNAFSFNSVTGSDSTLKDGFAFPYMKENEGNGGPKTGLFGIPAESNSQGVSEASKVTQSGFTFGIPAESNSQGASEASEVTKSGFTFDKPAEINSQGTSEAIKAAPFSFLFSKPAESKSQGASEASEVSKSGFTFAKPAESNSVGNE